MRLDRWQATSPTRTLRSGRAWSFIGKSGPVGVTIDLDVAEVGLDYVGEDGGKIADPSLRDQVIRWKMQRCSLRPSAEPVQRPQAVQRRVLLPRSSSSMAHRSQDRQDLTARLMGTQGAGWEGDGFSRRSGRNSVLAV